MEAGREGKRGEGGCLACEQSLLLPGLRGGEGRVGGGGAVRDLARRLDPGRVLLLSSIFFPFTFMKFLTQNKHF